MPLYEGYRNIVVTIDGGILTCRLNRPEVLNALDQVTFLELQNMFTTLVTDNTVRVVVLTGTGRAFCAGGDIKAMARGEMTRGFEWPWGSMIEISQFLQAQMSVPQPMIAALNGDAVGAGASVALFCDIVLAADTARIGDAHVRRGLVPSDGVVIFPLLLGFNKAKELLLTGNLISANEAERLGLVNHVYPPAELERATRELAEQLANGATAAIRWTKEVLNKVLWERWNLLANLAAALEELSARSTDHEEGVKSALEKRPPLFTGR